MKYFRLEEDFLGVLPESRIGILICEGIDNRIKDPEKYAKWLAESQELARQYIEEDVFTDNPIIRKWRDAFYKFKQKKEPAVL